MSNQDPIQIDKSTLFELWNFPQEGVYGVLDKTSEAIVYISRSYLLAKLYYYWKVINIGTQFSILM